MASYVLNTALAPRQKSNTPEAATEDDWNLPEPTEGTPAMHSSLAICWSEDWFVLAYGNYRYEAIKK
ncbi:Uncharacterised protein [Klebsiella pneumoniae subsp. ozaenae]|uniref:Uncharacterized protein n=1 Tax=Klebsiella pneumoniae subsp. ozaenae TaxID=574 RepID=A0A378AFA7_KLEPO|nr:Uncharacterised protein [Klebsiella pneumoniae subsp. ozaenae]